MSPSWFQFLLVGCLAIQQIVGGISCCCFTGSWLSDGEFASCCAVSQADRSGELVGQATSSKKPCCRRSDRLPESGPRGVIGHSREVGRRHVVGHESGENLSGSDRLCSGCQCAVGRELWVRGTPNVWGEEFGEGGAIRAWTSAWHISSWAYGEVDAAGLRKRSLDVCGECGGRGVCRCALFGRWNC